MSRNSPGMFEYQAPEEDAANDGLFLERLDTFMEKSLGDIKAFAERELRPYEETRRCIAQWHAKYLFQSRTSSLTTEMFKDGLNRSEQVRTVLCDISHILEGLSATVGVQSFLLAVDPSEDSDGGFLGGSIIGREFWRGLRGGGESGAKAFKTHSRSHLHSATKIVPSRSLLLERQFSTPPPKQGPAKSIKNELYEGVRTALRLASGVRNAEMKWTNPERLDVYGVRLVGWPEGIPAQNPSSLKAGQNKVLLEALQRGSMKFERTLSSTYRARYLGNDTDGENINDDFSWAYDMDAGSDSLLQDCGTAAPTSPGSSQERGIAILSPSGPVALTNESITANGTENVEFSRADEVDPAPSKYTNHHFWEGESEMDTTTRNEYYYQSDLESPRSGRPRKRPRSTEPTSSDSDIT